MNIVDSSCWFEYLMGSEIGANVADVIENPNELVVPTITIMDVKHYQKIINTINLLKILSIGENNIKNNKIYTQEKLDEEINKILEED